MSVLLYILSLVPPEGGQKIGGPDIQLWYDKNHLDVPQYDTHQETPSLLDPCFHLIMSRFYLHFVLLNRMFL